MEKEHLSTTSLAHSLGVSRSSLYYVPKLPPKDIALRDRIIETLTEHPAYGHRRLALHLLVNKKRTLRVMQKFGLTPTIRRKRPAYGRRTSVSGTPNRTAGISPIAPNVIWVGDFTELHFHSTKLYLATVIDRYTREVIAWQIGLHHTTQLVIDVLEEAFRKRGISPTLFHSDQGSEYTAHACMEWLTRHHILPSHSGKAKPWNNGHQESFYSRFKLEFGKPSRHRTIEILIEAIGRYMHYYNTRRIHSALKMPPQTYCREALKRYTDFRPGGV